MTRSTSTVRSGSASRAHNSGASNALAYTTWSWGLQGQFGYYVRCYFNVSALPASSATIMSIYDSLGAQLVSCRLLSTGKVRLWNDVGAVQIGSDSTGTVATGSWFMVELFCKVISAGTDSAGLQLDGSAVASATGLALSTDQAYQVLLGWLDPPGANAVIYADDMAINNDQGTSQTSYPGSGKVVYLYPASDNARGANWTAGAGGTSNLWDAVNNVAPTTGVASGSATDTSQIKNANTSDTTGNYDANMDSYSTAGIASGDTIAVVEYHVLRGSSDTSNIQTAAQFVSNPSASEESNNAGRSAAVGTFGSSWVCSRGQVYSPSVTVGTQPVLRVGRRGTQTGTLHVSGMFMAVDYTPSPWTPETNSPATLRVVTGAGRW